MLKKACQQEIFFKTLTACFARKMVARLTALSRIRVCVSEEKSHARALLHTAQSVLGILFTIETKFLSSW